jgi:hypothetical protein
MTGTIDLSYRPKTYFRPLPLEMHLLSQVKGSVARRELKALLDAGKLSEAQKLAGGLAPQGELRRALESTHPMFMGGNYLPEKDEGQVEIARITIRSTTFDVTCVYARRVGQAIEFEVVDEYGGDTLQGEAKCTRSEPMTLGELTDFFLEAWRLLSVLKMNFEDDLDEALGFFSVQSDFYPDLDLICRQRVLDGYARA